MRSSPMSFIISQIGSPGRCRVWAANLRRTVMSIGELSLPMTSRSTPSHLAVLLGPLQSNHSAGSSHSQKDLASW